MADIAAIRAALAATLATVPDAGNNPYQLSTPSPPALEVSGVEELTRTTMQRGAFSLLLVVTGYVASTTDVGAQKRRDVWLATTGTSSVIAAIESNRTLGGLVGDLWVSRVEGNLRFAEGSMYGARWYVQAET